VLALILALLAYRKIAKERRTVFELEVLRELLAMFDGSTRVTDARALALIEALPPNDLVLWRNAAKAVAGRPLAEEDARAAVSKVLDEAGVPPDANPDERLAKACVKDIQNSISNRMDGLWRRVTRRSGAGRRAKPNGQALDLGPARRQGSRKGGHSTCPGCWDFCPGPAARQQSSEGSQLATRRALARLPGRRSSRIATSTAGKPIKARSRPVPSRSAPDGRTARVGGWTEQFAGRTMMLAAEWSGLPGAMMTSFPQDPQSRQSAQVPGSPSSPRSIVLAVRLMYAGAAAIPLILFIDVLTGGTTIQNASPGLPFAAVWLWMAQMNKRGRSSARTWSTTFFGIQTILFAAVVVVMAFLALLTATNIMTSDVVILVICGILYWIIGLVAIVLLWRRQSSEYYTYMEGRVPAA
jgi:hypothetical protein